MFHVSTQYLSLLQKIENQDLRSKSCSFLMHFIAPSSREFTLGEIETNKQSMNQEKNVNHFQ